MFPVKIAAARIVTVKVATNLGLNIVANNLDTLNYNMAGLLFKLSVLFL